MRYLNDAGVGRPSAGYALRVGHSAAITLRHWMNCGSGAATIATDSNIIGRVLGCGYLLWPGGLPELPGESGRPDLSPLSFSSCPFSEACEFSPLSFLSQSAATVAKST